MKTRTPPRSLQDALAFIADYVEERPTAVSLPLASAIGRVMAETIVTPVGLPRFDNAAMDGFAVRSDDLAGDGTALLKIARTITAGQTIHQELRAGEAMRIMTGALIPAGTGRVVMQEDTQIVGKEVFVRAPVNGRPHIRRVGEDVSAGSEVLKAGTRIGPGQLALLTALGIQSVRVIRKPKVALLSTGDELAEAPDPLLPGRIYDTNRPMLSLMIEAAGAEVTDLGIVRDDPEAILSTLIQAASTHDVLVTSGGASVGFADHLTSAVRRRGYLEFWKLDMRPGKPIGFGDIDHCPILLLPGNPLAAAIGFALFGRAIIARLEDRTSADTRVWELPFGSKFTKPEGRTQVLVGRLRNDPEGHHGTIAEPLPQQGSASLQSLSAAEILIILRPEQTTLVEGELVDVLPFW